MANPLGSAPGIMVGIGVGTAASAAIEPIVEPGRQQAWGSAPNRILAPGLYAALVAQGAMDLSVGRGLAKREGFNEDQFDRIVYLAQRAPDLALTLEVWRRGLFGNPTSSQAIGFVDHALAKAQIEKRYWAGLKELFNERLSAPVIALAIVRGIMEDEGNFLPVGPPSAVGNVEAFPVSPLPPLEEAQATGFDAERLRVLTAIAGRPMAPIDAAHATFRNIIQETDYDRAIAEGDLRNEWARAIFETARQILTPSQYAELELRGFYDRPARLRNTAKHGMSDADSDLLVDLQGRSIAVHQVTTGLARGGAFPGDYANVPQPYRAAIQRSNIRREWSELAYANRYSYPSGFQIKGEAQAGDLSEAETEQILLEVGWSPKWAKFFAAAWASKAATTKADPYVGKAQTQLWTATHKAFEKGTVDAATADSVLTNLVTNAADRAYILTLWETERNLGTPAQPPA